MKHKLTIVIEHDDDGYYAFVPELPGCQSQGDSREAAERDIHQAIELYLETLTTEEIRAVTSKEIYTALPEVAIA